MYWVRVGGESLTRCDDILIDVYDLFQSIKKISPTFDVYGLVLVLLKLVRQALA